MNVLIYTIFLFLIIYNYTQYLPDGTQIIMHYDEPVEHDANGVITEKGWEQLEEQDEKEHKEESKEWDK